MLEYGNDICGDAYALSQLAGLGRTTDGNWQQLNWIRLELHKAMEKRHQNSIDPPTMKRVDLTTVEEELSQQVFYGFP